MEPTSQKTDQFHCRCGCGKDVMQSLRLAFDRLEKKLGRKLYITSGARCPDHNRRVNGAKSSLHVSGLALDIATKDSLDQIEVLVAAKAVGFRGFGRAMSGTFVHIDLGLDRPRWAYDAGGKVVREVLRW